MRRSRLLSAACALVLLGAAAPALAQVGTPATPWPLPPVPAVEDRAYPGVIRYEADITDTERRIVSVRQTVPVSAGPMVLLYPKFIPGNHAPTGPIQLVGGLAITGGGRTIQWVRDTVDPYAFHIRVPEGVSEIEVRFQWLTQSDNANWRVVMTPEMVNLQFEKALLYPAGYPHSRIMIQPSVRMPEGWRYGVALETERFENGLATFRPVSVETLADSPMFAGVNYRRYDLDPGGRSPVNMNVVADEARQIAPSPEQLEGFRNLVDQADRLFGARHYDRYEFLVALTNKMGGIGLEHHRSSENTLSPNIFTGGWGSGYDDRTLLPHEYVHSWNGKFRRPSDQLTSNLNQPVQNTLLWVYEGQTEFWGEVLAARSGLTTRDEFLVNLAGVASFYDTQPGRGWRPLQDTTNHNLLGYRVPGQWSSWMRGTGDYYREALLVWLDADMLIRERTGGRKSLDDFAKTFFGVDDGAWTPKPYTFDDVVAALNAVHPHDWAAFLRQRLDAVGAEARAPLEGLARAGWRLTYVESPNEVERRLFSSWGSDFQNSLGFSLTGANNRIGSIRWGGPAFEAGIGAGWDLMAVNDRAASAEALRAAVTAAKGGSTPIKLTMRQGDRVRTVEMRYHGGLRYPRLERIEGTADRLTDLIRPRSR